MNKALHETVFNFICDKILAKEFKQGDVLDNRELAATLQTNVHVVDRAIENLVKETIVERRMDVVLVTKEAYEKAFAYKKNYLLQEALLPMYASLQQVAISPDELKQSYAHYITTKK